MTLMKWSGRVTLNITSQAIKLGDPISISGKFTPQPDCGGDLSDLQIALVIIDPNGQPVTPAPEVSTNIVGQFLLADYNGYGETRITDLGPGVVLTCEHELIIRYKIYVAEGNFERSIIQFVKD